MYRCLNLASPGLIIFSASETSLRSLSRSIFKSGGQGWSEVFSIFGFQSWKQTKSIFIKPSPHCKDDPNPNYLDIKYSQNIEHRYSDWKIRLHYTFSTIPPSSHLRANQFKTFGKWPECWVLRTLLSRVFLLLLTRQSADQRERYFLSTQV